MSEGLSVDGFSASVVERSPWEAGQYVRTILRSRVLDDHPVFSFFEEFGFLTIVRSGEPRGNEFVEVSLDKVIFRDRGIERALRMAGADSQVSYLADSSEKVCSGLVPIAWADHRLMNVHLASDGLFIAEVEGSFFSLGMSFAKALESIFSGRGF